MDMYMTVERGAVPLDELTREEAIDALKQSFREIVSTRETSHRMFELFRLRRG